MKIDCTVLKNQRNPFVRNIQDTLNIWMWKNKSVEQG